MKSTFIMIKEHLQPTWKYWVLLTSQLFLFESPFVILWFAINERILINNYIYLTIAIMVAFAFVYSHLSDRSFKNKMKYEEEKIENQEKQERIEIRNYLLDNKELLELYKTTPEEYKEPLGKILYYRYLSIKDNNNGQT